MAWIGREKEREEPNDSSVELVLAAEEELGHFATGAIDKVVLSFILLLFLSPKTHFQSST